jgi:hypothetical protein
MGLIISQYKVLAPPVKIVTLQYLLNHEYIIILNLKSYKDLIPVAHVLRSKKRRLGVVVSGHESPTDGGGIS